MGLLGVSACVSTSEKGAGTAGSGHTGVTDDTGRPDDTGGSGPIACEDRAPSVEIGTGDVIFESLEAGEPVVMVHGPQGGWHMLGSVRTHSMHNVIEVHFTVKDLESGVVVSDNLYRVAVVVDGECTGYYPGMYGYLNVTELATEHADRPPEVLGYKTVEMKMEVTDYEGRQVETSLLVTAQPDPIDVESPDVDTGGP